MGQCTSKNNATAPKGGSDANGTFNQMKKSDRQLRSGVKFKDIEFGGFIGYSTTINDVYTPSGVNGLKDVNGARSVIESGDREDREGTIVPDAIQTDESESLIPK